MYNEKGQQPNTALRFRRDTQSVESSATPTYRESHIYNARKSFRSTEYVDLLSKAIAQYRINPDYIDKGQAKVVVKNLKQAIKNKSRVEIANCLMQFPGAIDLTDEKGRTAIHYAFELEVMSMLRFLISVGGDINAGDLKGNSVLHMCVIQENSYPYVTTLLQLGADPNLKNKADEGPLHIAVQSERMPVIRQLLECPRTNFDLSGSRNNRPLHICAYHDFVMELIMLLEKGANYRLADSLGNLPIHVAVLSTSRRCAKTLYEFSKTQESSQLLSDHSLIEIPISQVQNNQGVTPLHAAVDISDMELVKMSLEYGGSIMLRDEEGNTPIHVACQRANYTIFQELINSFTGKDISPLINLPNEKGMNCLHIAAASNEIQYIKDLLKLGVDMEALDANGWSPLLLAASKGAFDACYLLIENGSDEFVHGYQFRNMVHMSILGQHDSIDKVFKRLSKNKRTVFLFNEKDRWGLTPLHYAAKLGRSNDVTTLLDCGANCTETSITMRSPIHLAAKHCQFSCLKRLMRHPTGERAVLYTDIKGRLALHYACKERNYDAVDFLLRFGGVNKQDNMHNTTLHFAAMGGHLAILERLHQDCRDLRDVANTEGNTALHIAAANNNVKAVLFLLEENCKLTKNKKGEFFLKTAICGEYADLVKDVVMHRRWNEIQEVMDGLNQSPFEDMIAYLPEMCEVAMSNNMISVGQPGKNDYVVAYNFNILQKQLSIDSERDDDPMKRVKMMIRYGRQNLLQHPLTLSYLDMKWRNYGRLMHSLGSLYYLVYLALFTALIWSYDLHIVPKANVLDKSGCKVLYYNTKDISSSVHLVSILLFLMNLIIFAKEIIQLFLLGRYYFLNLLNYLNWFLSITVLLQIAFTITEKNNKLSYTVGFVSLLYAWFNLLFELMRFKSIGVYVVMFIDVFKTLMRCWLVIIIALIAFTLAFYTIHRVKYFEDYEKFSTWKKDLIVACFSSYQVYADGSSNEEIKKIPSAIRPYTSLLMTFFRMMFMLVGEYENIDSIFEPFYSKNIAELHFPILTILFTSFGALIVSTMLINLFRGLAVGDIESILHNAELRLLIEKAIWLDTWEARFPKKIQIRIYHPQVTENFSRMSEEKYFMFTRSENIKEAGKSDLKALKDNIYALKDSLREQNKKINKLFSYLVINKKRNHTKSAANIKNRDL